MSFLKELKKPKPSPEPKPTPQEPKEPKAPVPCPKCGKVHKTRCPSKHPQSTRMLKAYCEDHDWIIRITRKCAAMGLPDCPVCHKKVKLEEPIPF